MRIDPDARLPISSDVGQLKVRLNDLFRLLAVNVNAIFTQIKTGTILAEYADDAAAATGGVTVGEFYRTGSIVKQRIT